MQTMQEIARDGGGEVLVVGDDSATARSVAALLGLSGFRVTIHEASINTRERIVVERPDLVLLVEGVAPATSMGWCRSLLADPRATGLPLVAVSNHWRRDLRVLWMEAGAEDYMCLLFDVSAIIARATILVARRRVRVSGEAREQVAVALLDALALQQPDIVAHMRRVAAISLRLGRLLGLAGEPLADVYFGALLHDLGKFYVAPALLAKVTPLTEDEWTTIRAHSVVGERLLRRLEFGRRVAPIVRHHHERLEGSGYPDGLAGEAIPFGARIVAVADAFDAMTNPCPYNYLLTPGAALGQIFTAVRSCWDPTVVRALAALLRQQSLDGTTGETAEARLTA